MPQSTSEWQVNGLGGVLTLLGAGVVLLLGTGVELQYSGVDPQYPNWEQHGAYDGHSLSEWHLPQNSGPYPQYPHSEQQALAGQSAFEWQVFSKSESKRGLAVAVLAKAISKTVKVFRARIFLRWLALISIFCAVIVN